MKIVLVWIVMTVFFGMSGFSAGLTFVPDGETPVLHRGDRIVVSYQIPEGMEPDSVQVDILYDQKETAYLNGKSTIRLERCSEGRLFKAELILKSCFTRSAREIFPKGWLLFRPVLIFGDEKKEQPPVKSIWQIQVPGLNIAGEVHDLEGCFGDSLHFSGRESMAHANLPFNPEAGTIEGRIFLPLLNSAKNGIVFYTESSDGSPWSWHTLQILSNSRTLQYVIYRSGKKEYVKAVTAKARYEDDWIYFALTYDLKARKMRLYINGELQGENEYALPVGGTRTHFEIGGRIHNSGDRFFIIESSNILLDELRISDCVRKISGIPAQPYVPDEHTLALFHFDGEDRLQNCAARKE